MAEEKTNPWGDNGPEPPWWGKTVPKEELDRILAEHINRKVAYGLDELKKTDLRGADLTNIDLSNKDLSYANLLKANLSEPVRNFVCEAVSLILLSLFYPTFPVNLSG